MLEVKAAPKLAVFVPLLFGLVAIFDAYAPKPLFMNDVDVDVDVDDEDVVVVVLVGIENSDDDDGADATDAPAVDITDSDVGMVAVNFLLHVHRSTHWHAIPRDWGAYSPLPPLYSFDFGPIYP